jgi:hypothetical protein
VIALGLLGFPLGLALILAPIGLDAGWVLRVPAAVVGGLLIGASYVAVWLGRRIRVRAGDWEAVERDPRPPIVYLRPFDADGVEYVALWKSRVRARPARRMLETTYEERLARALADVAPLVAIANPSAALLEPGATRLGAEDWEWQDRVAKLTSRAGSIILHAGVSDGLAWEVEHVVGLGAPERLIVALPADAPSWKPSRDERYAAFVRRFGDVFPRGLPDRAAESQFLFFDADWRPRPFGHRGSGAVSAPRGSPGQQRALVLERLRSEFKISLFPFWMRAGAGMSVLMVAGVAVATAIYAAVH